MQGGGLLNNIINNLPFELHLPGYQYCGPGTRLQKRLLRGDKGINKLDEACKRHDIAYSQYSKLEDRHKADSELLNMAKQRIKANDASKGEKLASWLVSKAIKTKLKLGAGVKQFKTIVSKIRSQLRKFKPKNDKAAIKFAYAAAKKIVSKNTRLRLPRIIPIPKTGGILPLIPIFAGLSAIGSLAGGAAGIAKAVNDYKANKKSLQETERHNRMMESIALGKGLYIKPYKNGSGLFLPKN
jgi:hypothetical protein